ncbi:hypothetical protein NM688_g6520 [Phlebia brevispora]|uniref:Uncharacterized protein n=1 Tax=Phlebia brevispora TaxID=194682 RepID=A0ACC1SF46_9APHY|nr:hypothetical protein NM688_g6520 [Phlebia brevispora]
MGSASSRGRTIKEDLGCTNAVAYSPDGSLVATCDWQVKIWDGHNGEFIKELAGHADDVKDVAFMRDGKRVVSGSSDQTVRVWDVDAETCLKVLQGHTGRVFSVAVSDKLIASGSGDSDPTIRLWDTNSYALLTILKGHNSWVLSLAFSPDAGQLVSASDDGTVRLWDVSQQVEGKTIGHEFAVTCVTFSTDGVLVATGSDDKTVAIWETQTGKVLHMLQDHTDRVCGVAFSPDRKRLASAGWNSKILIWDVDSGELTMTLFGHTKGIEAVAYSPDGKWLASGGNTLEPIIRIWDASNGTIQKTIDVDFEGAPIDVIETLEFSPDNLKLHTKTINSLERIWEVSTDDILDGTADGWELASARAAFREEDGWIISKKDNTKLCWIVGSKRADTTRSAACHGAYYAVGAGSGQFTIFDLNEF